MNDTTATTSGSPPPKSHKSPRTSALVQALIEQVAPNENLTPPQTSALLQVPVSTLAVWRCTNRVVLPWFRVGGHVRYRRVDIDRFIEENMRNAAEA